MGIIRQPQAEGAASKAKPLRTVDIGSVDSAGRLWVHGHLADAVRVVPAGTVPPLDMESATMATGLVRWCALVSAPLAMSASATVLVVCLARVNPYNGQELKWEPE